MGEDVKHPMRGLGLSSFCLQEKKGVLLTCVRSLVPDVCSSYSLTVDHFSSLQLWSVLSVWQWKPSWPSSALLGL